MQKVWHEEGDAAQASNPVTHSILILFMSPSGNTIFNALSEKAYIWLKETSLALQLGGTWKVANLVPTQPK